MPSKVSQCGQTSVVLHIMVFNFNIRSTRNFVVPQTKGVRLYMTISACTTGKRREVFLAGRPLSAPKTRGRHCPAPAFSGPSLSAFSPGRARAGHGHPCCQECLTRSCFRCVLELPPLPVTPGLPASWPCEIL